MTTTQFDIIIVGTGIVGAAFAAGLAQSTSLSIAVVDAQEIACPWSANHYDFRVSAISPASQKILATLNVWPAIAAKRISPFRRMEVWDASSKGRIQFDSQEIGQPALGYIIENNALRASLLELLVTYSQITKISSAQLTNLTITEEAAELTTAQHGLLQAKLIIGADGTNSWIRQQARLAITQDTKTQTAIVCTVQTELPHQATAWQRFLPTGPLAFLPLKEAQLSSIVWSLPTTEAERLLALSADEFNHELGVAFEHKLGKILQSDKRRQFSLRRLHANHYVKSRLALIGDAAHTIHPLAGQGVNLGLLDADCLTEVIGTALNKKRDFASYMNLRRYERARKSNNFAMFNSLEILNNLFASEQKFLQNVRGLGLNVTNQFSWLKNFFAHYAVGQD